MDKTENELKKRIRTKYGLDWGGRRMDETEYELEGDWIGQDILDGRLTELRASYNNWWNGKFIG